MFPIKKLATRKLNEKQIIPNTNNRVQIVPKQTKKLKVQRNGKIAFEKVI